MLSGVKITNINLTKMTTAGSGAVFFLGSRAHYQVLQQPESAFDAENGNASTETIYQNPSVQELWANEQRSMTGGCDEKNNYNEGWSYCDNDGTEDKDKIDIGNGIKRRMKRRPSETTLCERDDNIKPASLNTVDDSALKSKSSGRRTILRFLSSLSRRKRRLDTDQIQYLQHLECALTTCSYRESCRCLDCQSRYFECDESEEYSSEEESEYSARYVPQVVEQEPEPEEDDEVFVDTVPGDNTSTDMLLDNKEKMSTSSDETLDEDKLQLEVAATTPVLLNYLLTHPITCVLQ